MHNDLDNETKEKDATQAVFSASRDEQEPAGAYNSKYEGELGEERTHLAKVGQKVMQAEQRI